MSHQLWADLGSVDFQTIDPETTIVIFPVGATEQHGPHLPLCVDSTLVMGVLARTLDLAPPNARILVLPHIPIGKSNEHAAFPGTLTIGYETLMRFWLDVAQSALRAGPRKILILNGHGGQTAATQMVARELRVQNGALAVAIDWWGARAAPQIYAASEYHHGIHGGAEETAMMMHLRPDLVRAGSIQNFVPQSAVMEQDYPHLFGARRMAWAVQDLHASGACGDASLARSGDGRAIIDDAARALADLLDEMLRFPLAQLKSYQP